MKALYALSMVLLLGLAGCGIQREPAAGDPDGVFAHPEGYEESHGLAADGGLSPCGTCHGLRTDDPVLGATPAAPACRSCHAAYPHPASFSSGLVHGPSWTLDPTVCSACHGEDGTRQAGGTARGQCVGCHSTYPHAPGWETIEGHGAALRARGPTACQGCHGTDGAAISEAACTECHLAPHPAGFADPAAHSAVYDAAPEACASCHAAEAGIDGRRLCASCHDLFPHPADWASHHAGPAQRRGDGACLTCHDEGLDGPTLPVSCGVGCHDGGAP